MSGKACFSERVPQAAGYSRYDAGYGCCAGCQTHSGRQADYYEELSKIAPTIHLGVNNENYLESFSENMNKLGEIFGKEKAVEKELTAITEAIEELPVQELEVTPMAETVEESEEVEELEGSEESFVKTSSPLLAS
mgnify:CR=1 FL=1